MSRLSHRKRIYADIHGRILRGEISPDDRLVDTTIATEMGVSRMPVREALMQLVSEGYLEGTSRGFTLPNLAHDRILEVFVLRRLLEPHAAASAAQARTDVELAAMRSALDTTSLAMETGDFETFHRASEVFRNAWLAAVPNLELRHTIQRYSGQVQMVRLATMRDPDARRTIVEGQREQLDAFTNRDGVAAGVLLLRFVFEGERSYSLLRAANAKTLSTSS